MPRAARRWPLPPPFGSLFRTLAARHVLRALGDGGAAIALRHQCSSVRPAIVSRAARKPRCRRRPGHHRASELVSAIALAEAPACAYPASNRPARAAHRLDPTMQFVQTTFGGKFRAPHCRSVLCLTPGRKASGRSVIFVHKHRAADYVATCGSIRKVRCPAPLMDQCQPLDSFALAFQS